MIYISHLVLDDDMKALVKEYGTGIESIDFSISDNLDRLSDSIKTYWEKMREIGTRGSDSSRSVSGCEPLCIRQSGAGSHHDKIQPVL